MSAPLVAPEREPSDDERRAAYIATHRSPARYLIARGAAYASPVEGTDWYEVDSRSDGMCGSVSFENPWTTEYQSFHWSIDDPTCRSQDDAREAASETFRPRVTTSKGDDTPRPATPVRAKAHVRRDAYLTDSE